MHDTCEIKSTPIDWFNIWFGRFISVPIFLLALFVYHISEPEEVLIEYFVLVITVILGINVLIRFTKGIRNLLQYQKYGSSTLQLSSHPVMTGRSISGVIRAPEVLSEKYEEVSVKIRCYDLRKNLNTVYTHLWSDSSTISGMHWLRNVDANREWDIPVSFDLPADLPPTGEVDTDEYYRREVFWEIEIWGDGGMVPYRVIFPLNVNEPDRLNRQTSK